MFRKIIKLDLYELWVIKHWTMYHHVYIKNSNGSISIVNKPQTTTNLPQKNNKNNAVLVDVAYGYLSLRKK